MRQVLAEADREKALPLTTSRTEEMVACLVEAEAHPHTQMAATVAMQAAPVAVMSG